MIRKLLITSAIVAVSSLGMSIGADAREMGAGINAGGHVGTVGVGNRAGFNARASARGPHFTPPGWRHGRKTGWRGGSRPPGLR